MTPNPPPRSAAHANEAPVPTGCGALLAYFVIWFAILTPAIMIGWNVGLQKAGIVPREIAWSTAFGLAVIFSLVRSFVMSVAKAASR